MLGCPLHSLGALMGTIDSWENPAEEEHFVRLKSQKRGSRVFTLKGDLLEEERIAAFGPKECGGVHLFSMFV